MDSKWLVLVGVVAIVLIAFGAWALLVPANNAGLANAGITQANAIKIGVSAVLTGEAANWGENALAGIQLATDEINAQGGINRKKIELVIEDDRASATEAATTFNKLVNLDKVTALLSASGSGATAAGLPISQAGSVPTIIVTATNPNLTKTGRFVFRVTASDSLQGKAAAELLFNTLNKKKAAIVFVQNEWGQGLDTVFKNRFKELGGEVTYESGASQTELDYKTELAKIMQSGAEALYFPLYPDGAIAAFKQMNETGFSLPILGGDMFTAPELRESGFAEGVMYVETKASIPSDFEERIHSQQGFENLKVFYAAALGYDSAKILYAAIEKAGTNPEAIRNALAQTSYSGVSNASIEFDSQGDLKNAEFEIKVIRDKKSENYR